VGDDAEGPVIFANRRVKRTRKGDFEIRLADAERDLLARLVPQLRELLTDAEDGPDSSLRRLFPTAYPDDPERDEEYHRLVHDDLLGRHAAALDTLEATVQATRLDEEELLAWMGAVNDLRLVLGTRLDVSEETDYAVDPSDPDAGAIAVYSYLGFLLEHIVAALAD
jgi:hypothetical protein